MYVAKPPSLEDLWDSLNTEDLRRLMATDLPEDGRYLHWDRLRHLEPPQDLSHEQWWLLITMARRRSQRSLPLRTVEGTRFTFQLPDRLLELLHRVDQRCAGRIAIPDALTSSDDARQHYLVNSLIEEAIRSSQLEGATTSRQAAKEMLRSGRKPRDRGERMILNNYRAINFMRERVNQDLSPELILELHRIVTEGTLDNPESAGRLQTAEEDRVAVYDRDDGSPVHLPPPADELPERMERLCRFANEEDNAGAFLHPVLKAVLLHFQLAYDHPFEDGNGRTARALFYWQMLKSGYWLTEYLSISRVFYEAPSKYVRAFMLTETDGGDTTYFLLYHLEAINRAIGEFDDYLSRKAGELRQIERLIRQDGRFNRRQLELLGAALRQPGRVFSVREHASIHLVSQETARLDFKRLIESGLLVRESKDGHTVLYMAPPDLERRLRRP